MSNSIPSDDFLALTLANEQGLEAQRFTLDNGTQVDIYDSGIISFQPNTKTTDDVVLGSAVHGDETAPIEICNTLIRQVLSGELTLNVRLMVLFGSPAAINIHKRFVDENMNRLFGSLEPQSGDSLNYEQKRAVAVKAALKSFFEYTTVDRKPRQRHLYDLHTAIRGSKHQKFAVYPFLHGKPWQISELSFLQKSAVNTVLLMNESATTLSYFGSHFYQASAFTIELGKVKPFGQNDMNEFKDVIATLTELLTAGSLSAEGFELDAMNIFTVHKVVNKQSEDFALNFADDVENFTDFPLGYELAIDGETVHRVDTAGEAVIFPNKNVVIGQRALLTVVPENIEGRVE